MIAIVNINYKAQAAFKLSSEDFIGKKSPQMLIYTSCDPHQPCKLLVFQSGKCRIMGCKKTLVNPTKCFPTFPLKMITVQSITATLNLGRSLNLIRLSHQLPRKHCLFEAELFPALRLMSSEFLPHCINVFASGKVVILGIHSLSSVIKLGRRISNYINMHYKNEKS